jgi:hypothetical protein
LTPVPQYIDRAPLGTGGRRALAVVSLTVAIALGAWIVAILVTGGMNTRVFGITIRAHGIARPATFGAAALAVFLWTRGFSRTLTTVAGTPHAIASVLAASVLIMGFVNATGVAGGSDSYGYLSQAELWRSGLPIVSQPWALDPPWPDADRTFIPLGYTRGQEPGVIVPSYAAGFPLLLAAMQSIAGQRAMFLIVPAAGAVLVLVTYAVGRRAGVAAGLAGAWLVATNATLLSEVTSPMSDVVAAAALAGSCWLVLNPGRGTAALAGLAAALAVLVRPNLAPTVFVMAAWLAVRRYGPEGRRDLARTLIFASAAAPGFVATAWINWRFYGSPFVSGYGSLSSIYHWSNVLPNLERYLALLVASHAPLAIVGFVAIAAAAAGLWRGIGDRQTSIGIALFVFSIVLPYLMYHAATGPGYLRFLLPCWPFVMPAAAALLFAVARSRTARTLVAIAVVAYAVHGFRLSRSGGLLQEWRNERRYPLVATLVRERTVPSSVVFADQHSGSLRHYGGRVTLRYDQLDPAWLDRSIAWLAAQGAHPYALLDGGEVQQFRQRFAGQERIAALNTPIVVYRGGTIVHFYDLLRPGNDFAPPEYVLDRFERMGFVSPAPPSPFAFAR